MSGSGAGAGPSAEWTLLLYMAGVQGGLARAEARLLDVLAGARSSPKLAIVYEINTAQETRRGRIGGAAGKPEILIDGPRIDAAKPTSLTSFVDWAQETFPSRYTALVLKGHGGGLDRPPTSGLPGDAGGKRRPPRPLEILDDETTNQYLGVRDLRTAIAQTRRQRVDFCGLDACDMGLLEVAYEVRDAASYLVATQSVELSNAWPYRRSMEALGGSEPVGPRALAEIVATGSQTAFLAAMDLGWIGTLASSVDRIGDALTPILWAHRRDVESIRARLTSFGIENQYVDLKQLLTALDGVLDRALLDDARASLERVCIAKVPMVLSGGVDAGGLSIFFPRPSGSTYLASYGGLEIARQNRWAGFVGEFCFPSPGG